MVNGRIRIWPLLVLSALGCMGRCLQCVFFIDRVTGYVTSDIYNVFIIVFYAVCIAVFIVPLLTGAIRERALSFSGAQNGSLMYTASLICTIYSLFLAAVTLIRFIGLQVFGRLYLLPFAFIALCAVYFAVLTVKRGAIGERALLTILGPIGFYAYRMVTNFNRLTLNTEVTSYRLMLIASGLTLLFFSFWGRSQFDDTGVIKTAIFGGATFFFLAVGSVCPLIMRFLDQFGNFNIFTEEISVLLLMADAVVMIFVLAVLKNIKIAPLEKEGTNGGTELANKNRTEGIEWGGEEG